MKVSEHGLAFIADHEGFVFKAYRCPAGVITIGYGFTMGSTVFASWWRAKQGRALRLGDTLNRYDADMLLQKLLDAEYGAAVNRDIGTAVQREHDGSSSVSFNCGTGSLKWKWAKLLKLRKVADSAARLRRTAVMANGRRLSGLVRRRSEEARLIEHGNYGAISTKRPASVSSGYVEVRAYQKQLVSLGYDLGPSGADGLDGKQTIDAVKAFQKDHDLVVDGIVGPATRATLIRELDRKMASQALKAGPVAGAGGSASFDISPLPVDHVANSDLIINAALWGGGALLAVGLAVVLLRYRGVLTGRRVPT